MGFNSAFKGLNMWMYKVRSHYTYSTHVANVTVHLHVLQNMIPKPILNSSHVACPKALPNWPLSRKKQTKKYRTKIRLAPQVDNVHGVTADVRQVVFI